MSRPLKVEFNPPAYNHLKTPEGCLVHERGCAALWHYYATMTANLSHTQKTLVLEGEPDHSINAGGLWLSIAMMYGTDPNTMANFWPYVHREIARQNLVRLEGEKLLELPLLYQNPPRKPVFIANA